MLEGEVVVDTADGAFALGPGDYGVTAIGAPHALRNVSDAPARWAGDVGAAAAFAHRLATRTPCPRSRSAPRSSIDVRDPRTRSFGHIDPGNMEVDRQTQDMLAVSASMRTALLVYSGITVKMMIDAELGAQHLTMFMVQYEPRGFAGAHDHPFEETYLILEGEVDATFDDEPYRLGPGDIAWAGVGLRPLVREPRAGERAMARDAGAAAAVAALVPVRARLGPISSSTRRDGRGRSPDARRSDGRIERSWWSVERPGWGMDLAQRYAEQGRARGDLRTRRRAGRLDRLRDGGPRRRASRSTCRSRRAIAPALADVGPVDRLALAALQRDLNTVRDYDIEAAVRLVTLKLVGYTEVVHACSRD